MCVASCSDLAPPVIEPVPIEVQPSPPGKFDASNVLLNPNQYLEDALENYRNEQVDTALKVVTIIHDNPTNQALLSASGRFLLSLLDAHFALDTRRDPNELVRDLKPTSLGQRIDALELWSRYLKLMDRNESSIASLMAAKRLARDIDPTRQPRLNAQLWDLLVGIPYQQLTLLQNQTDDPDLHGWLEVAGIFNNSLSITAWRVTFDDWAQRHLRHESVAWLQERMRNAPEGPDHIAILLPQSGSDAYSQAARGIRDGWMLAYMVDMEQIDQNELPKFTFYDTVGKNHEQLIFEAFANGADHVVGPLSKDAVNAIQDTRTLPGSILMLNTPNSFGTNRPDSMRYLAWSIEDEALTLARSLSTRDQVRCVVIYGNEPWMIRARAEFELNLAAPSRVIAVNRISEFEQLTEEVGVTIGIEESEQRRDAVEAMVQYPLEFQPRMNQEIDSIVAFIDSSQLEAVLESLRFHADRPLNIYVTDSAVRGKLPELAEGIQFTTDTWRIFNTDLADTVNEIFDSNPNMASFYAIGIDAYRFSNLWSHMKVSKMVAGSGSRYRLESNGNIRRVPYWGAARNQALVPLIDVTQQHTSNPYL